ncbi:unnamed protein product [Allacma fusca]|uniref:Uncharacterized protein n=1 Tax=Allacma fusca TaxID=39272 RepID=A0A8J2KWG6_9HEXA|nr:unnamed protein product [Allacma fusca]
MVNCAYSMAYNGGLEDPQNWPFSVRYTASPYRKSKFPVDVHGETTTHWSNSAFPNGTNTVMSGNNTDGHFHNVSYPYQYVNMGPSSLHQHSHHFYQPNGEYPVQDGCSGSGSHETQQYSIPGSDQHLYGLPAPHSLPPSSSDCNFFMRYPRHRLNCVDLNRDPSNLSQVQGIVDEGYIEDLKKPYMSSKNKPIAVGAESDNINLHCDPYSYVYDSKIHEDLSVISVLCCGKRDSSSSASIPMQYSGSLLALSSSRNDSSENEYEEIHDVARYINNSTGPLHFKSFSSTDDTLAEVVEVQQRHDRVLDQLNLEVENLLISSSNDMVEGNKSRDSSAPLPHVNGPLDKMTSLSLNGIYQECYCDEIPSMPQFGTIGNLRAGVVNSLSKDICCCESNRDVKIVRSRRSNSLTHNGFHNDAVPKAASIGDDYISGLSGPNNTLSRKTKLEPYPNQLSDSNPKLKLSNHHDILPSTFISDKHCKNRHHRAYSLIPHWKIREHLRRLPFLRQQRKFISPYAPMSSLFCINPS